jgi:predicted permease
MSPGGGGNGLLPEGKVFDVKDLIHSRLRMVTPAYFETMRIPILKGRAITDEDRWGGVKVMVISESLARAAFPGEDPIGKRISCCEPGPDGKGADLKTVVGVAGDVRWRGPAEAPSPEFYLPIDQAPAVAWAWVQRTMYVVVRTTLDPQAMSNPLRTAVGEIAPGVPLFNVRSMNARVSDSLASAQFNTLLLTLLGVIGLILAAVGIYSLISYFVTRRSQEIGVRMALGATRRDVVGLVVRQAAWPIGIGIASGMAMSAILTRVLSQQLFGVTPGDPVTFTVVVLTLTAAALLASLVPARKAAALELTRALQIR